MSDTAFASLTPTNPLARLAFSDVYDALTSGRQNNPADDARGVLRRMLVKPEQECDNEIVYLRREIGRTRFDSDGEASESLTEPDTDTEEEFRQLGMVWIGSYLLELESPPAAVERGWTVGKGPLENISIDMLLCTRAFAKAHDLDIRNPHARFNFFLENKGLYIAGCSRSSLAQLTVNGDATSRQPYYLNQHSMKIHLGKLEYCFQWMDFAAKDAFKDERRRYIAEAFSRPPIDNIDIEMPTPLPTKRTIGRWTLGETLGAGGQGRVFFGSDSSGNIAAIKVVERRPRTYHVVDEEIETLKEVTKFLLSSDDSERVLRMVDVIYTRDAAFSSTIAFDNVAMVLQPITPRTFADLIGSRSNGGGHRGMTIETATVFRDALLGVKVMHNGRWAHRDLKPANIGLVGTPRRSVLLDVGTSKHIKAGELLQPMPGQIGTIGYLAPEFELENYDHAVDIWAMGIILFQLTYNYHPWTFSLNPWREGNEDLRSSFQLSYKGAIAKMTKDYTSARASPTEGYIHLGGLLSKWSDIRRRA